MSNSNLARAVITTNATFSLITGIALSLFPTRIASLLFAEPAGWQFWILLLTGLGLIPFALFLLYLARNPLITKFEVMLVIDADILWVIGSFAVLYFFPDLFTELGLWTIVLSALIVGCFAIGQFIGSRAMQTQT